MIPNIRDLDALRAHTAGRPTMKSTPAAHAAPSTPDQDDPIRELVADLGTQLGRSAALALYDALKDPSQRPKLFAWLPKLAGALK